jgi:hypothetical protein
MSTTKEAGLGEILSKLLTKLTTAKGPASAARPAGLSKVKPNDVVKSTPYTSAAHPVGLSNVKESSAMTQGQLVALSYAKGFLEKCAQAEVAPEAVDEGGRLGSYIAGMFPGVGGGIHGAATAEDGDNKLWEGIKSMLGGTAGLVGGGLLGSKLGRLLGKGSAKMNLGKTDLIPKQLQNWREVGPVLESGRRNAVKMNPFSKAELIGLLGGGAAGSVVGAGETLNAMRG